MSIIRSILTVLFGAFAVVGVVSFLNGSAPASALIFSIAYIFTALALVQRGGAVAKYVAYFTGFILCLGFLIALYAMIQPMSGGQFEPILFGAGLFMGLIGIETIQQLRNIKKLQQKENTNV